MGLKAAMSILLFSMFASAALANDVPETNPLEGVPEPLALISITIVVLVLSLGTSFVHKMKENEKKIAFVIISASVVISTVYLAGHTVYLNIVSESGGPVHWHADYEIWVCGQKLDMINPKGFASYVGSPVLHEHNDDRIHVEGVVVHMRSINLESYLDVIGGKLGSSEMAYPTENGVVAVKNGDMCSGLPAKLQAFVYRTDGKKYNQEKLADFARYVLSPHPQVPPGDCIIIEFDAEKARTEKMCETYKIAIEKGDIIGG